MRTSAELREGFLAFFESKGHLRLPSASLVPETYDPSVLLTTVPKRFLLCGTCFLSLFREHACASIPVLRQMVKPRLDLYFTDG